MPNSLTLTLTGDCDCWEAGVTLSDIGVYLWQGTGASSFCVATISCLDGDGTVLCSLQFQSGANVADFESVATPGEDGNTCDPVDLTFTDFQLVQENPAGQGAAVCADWATMVVEVVE